MIKALERILLGVAAVITVLIAVIAWRQQTVPEEGALAFDARAWRADDSGCAFYSRSVRQRMAPALAVRLIAPPHTRAQVEALLGEPDLTRSDERWSYSAGTSTMDCVSFDVVFDADGVVSRAGLVQH